MRKVEKKISYSREISMKMVLGFGGDDKRVRDGQLEALLGCFIWIRIGLRDICYDLV